MGLSEARYLELHKQFLAARRSKTELAGKILDYKTYEDQEDSPYSGFQMRTVEDAKTGVNELLNWINHFAAIIENYAAWAEVLEESQDEQERFSTLFEIISPISFLALSFPAAIRGKFVYVCARMIRDTFNVKKGVNNFLDDHLLNEKRLISLVRAIADSTLRSEIESSIQTLTEIDGKSFRETTSNYRNRANHGIAPYIEIGERMAFAPMSGTGFEGFTFGVEKAIRLNTLMEPLVEQHANCTNSMKAFLPVLMSFRERWRTATI